MQCIVTLDRRKGGEGGGGGKGGGGVALTLHIICQLVGPVTFWPSRSNDVVYTALFSHHLLNMCKRYQYLKNAKISFAYCS